MTKKKLKTFQWGFSLFICALLFMMVPDMIHQGYFMTGFLTFFFSISYGLLSVYKFEKWA